MTTRQSGTLALLGCGLGAAAAYLALASRFGLWAAVYGEFWFLGAYGVAAAFYALACLTIWRVRPSGRATLALVIGFALLCRVIALFEPPMESADVYRYVWDGRVVAAGLNPYSYPPSAPELAHLAIPTLANVNSPDVITPYPPLAEVVFAGLYLLWPNSVVVFKAFAVVCDLAVIGLLVGLLRRLGRPTPWVVVYAWSPLPIYEFAAQGHVDVLMMALLLAAMLLATAARKVASGAALGLAVLAKLFPILLWPALSRRLGWRGTATLGIVVAAGALPFAGAGDRFMSGALAMADRWYANASIYRWFLLAYDRYRFVEYPGETYRALAAVAVVLVALVAGLLGQRSDLSLFVGCFWVLAVALLLSTTVFPWYVAWVLPFLTLILASSVPDWSLPAYIGWWLFALTVTISYLAFLTGEWPVELSVAEYGPVYAGLGWAGMSGIRRLLSSHPTASVTRSAASVETSPIVGVVIPTLNEEESIGDVIRAIPPGLAREVVVVDGGSTDRTVDLAEAAGARVIHEPRRGYGRACATGAEALDDVDVVVFLDGDRSDFPEEMVLLLQPIAQERADLVVGSRLRGHRQPGALPLHSVAGNWLAALLMRLLYGLPITDLGPFRAIRREALAGLGMVEMTYGWPVEMLAKAGRRGLRVVEVPVSYRRRRGRSKITGTLRGSVLASYLLLSGIFRYLRA